MSERLQAYHEAGHAVAAIALGTPIKRASLDRVTTLVRPGCPQAQRNEAIIALSGPRPKPGTAVTPWLSRPSYGAASGGLIWTTRCAACELPTVSVWRCGKRAGSCARTGARSSGWRRPCRTTASLPLPRSTR